MEALPSHWGNFLRSDSNSTRKAGEQLGFGEPDGTIGWHEAQNGGSPCFPWMLLVDISHHREEGGAAPGALHAHLTLC